jgi:hypothetical protein
MLGCVDQARAHVEGDARELQRMETTTMDVEMRLLRGEAFVMETLGKGSTWRR